MDGLLSVTKRFEFDYAHKLPDYDGPCSRLHGHRGVLEVELVKEGLPNQFNTYEGMVIDFTDLKRVVKEVIIDRFDHYYLNDILAVPTAENMVKFTVKKLKEHFGRALIRVRIYETPSSFAEWRAR